MLLSQGFPRNSLVCLGLANVKQKWFQMAKMASQSAQDAPQSYSMAAKSGSERQISKRFPTSANKVSNLSQASFAIFASLGLCMDPFFYLFRLSLIFFASFCPKCAKMSRSRQTQNGPEPRISKEFLGLPRFSRCKPKMLSGVQNVSSKCPRRPPKVPKVCQRGPK